MKVTDLQITRFRNHTEKALRFEEKTVIVGGNGSGKSNLLEAIYLTAVAKSFRADSDSEMIAYGEKAATVRVEAAEAGGKVLLEVFVHNGTAAGPKKRFRVNGVPRRSLDFAGKLKAVMFCPPDMDLISGSPAGRRRYLDFVISQSDREYRRCLISYEKGLRQRNRLLDRIREGLGDRGQLFFWDRLLIKNGNYLTDKRFGFLEFLSRQKLNGGMNFRCRYDKSEISEGRLAQYESEEVAAATTLVGPHRDDFRVEFEDADQGDSLVDAAKYGSRGEQRMGVLWLKTGEFNYLKQQGEVPVLLLDDIFSELDLVHREVISEIAEKAVTDGGQVIMTTADELLVPKSGWKVIRI